MKRKQRVKNPTTKGRVSKPYSLKYFTEEHLKKMGAKIDNVEDLTLIMCGAEFGIRASEMCGITKANLHLDNKTVDIYDKKKDEHRTIRFTDKISGLLSRFLKVRRIRKGREAFLFPYNSKTIDRKVKYWANAVEIHEWVSWHTLRRTYVVLSKKYGRSIKTVQRQTGDAVRTIIEYYDRPTEEDLRQDTDEHPILPDGL